jgi:hypothetical protein
MKNDNGDVCVLVYNSTTTNSTKQKKMREEEKNKVDTHVVDDGLFVQLTRTKVVSI